jgi:GTP-binding protein EngB required for normal cell division
MSKALKDPALDPESVEPQYVFVQRREGVAVTLNVKVGQNPTALLEEYRALIEAVADMPGYGYRKEEPGEHLERVRRHSYARSRR